MVCVCVSLTESSEVLRLSKVLTTAAWAPFSELSVTIFCHITSNG